jgi:hypothetical protein
VRCVAQLPPREVHLSYELFSSTTITDWSIHSRTRLFVRSICHMSYSPPQLSLIGPSILVHVFSFSSTPLSLPMVLLVTPQRPAELLLRGALAMPPTTAPSRSCSSASQGHARCGSSHTQSLPAARSTSAARTATPNGQGRSWGAGARRCSHSPRLGVVLRCL